MNRRFPTSIAIILTVFLSMTMMFAPPASAAWSNMLSLKVSPHSVYSDNQAMFTFNLTNTGSSYLEISDFDVSFDWDESKVFDLLDSKISIFGGKSKEITLTTFVPKTEIGEHAIRIDVTAKAAGDWLFTKKTWFEPVSVMAIPPLELSADAYPLTGRPPLAVDFYVTISGGLPPYSFDWDFGDGNKSNESQPRHVFDCEGNYTVILTVRDSKTVSQVAVAVLNITVSSNSSMRSSSPWFFPSFEEIGEIEPMSLIGAVMFVAVILSIAFHLADWRKRKKL